MKRYKQIIPAGEEWHAILPRDRNEVVARRIVLWTIDIGDNLGMVVSVERGVYECAINDEDICDCGDQSDHYVAPHEIR